MSGVISAAFTLANILFGVGGVSVGDFTALGLETPERMPFGGSQRTAVHHLLGGARVIDLLGPDEADITWSGYFSGPDAADRARQVDIMRQSGDAVPLSWPGDSRTVIITEFKCSYERGGYLLPYSITCMVVPDVETDATPSLLGQLAGDVADGLGITDAIADLTPALASASAALQTVQEALPVAAALTGGSAAFLAVQGAVAGASGIISGGLALADGAMGGVIADAASVGGIIAGTDGNGAIASLTTVAAAAKDLAGLTATGGFVGRMAANLENASS